MTAPSPLHWRALAAALQLTPYRPTARYEFGASFRQVKRALGVPSDASSFGDYLYGTHRGVEVIVHTFDIGAGHDLTTFTCALARIDPPLFLGLGLRARGLLEGLFGTPRILVGDPRADGELHVDAFQPERAAALLSPRDAEGSALLAQVLGTLKWHLLVGDSTVRVADAGIVTDPLLVTWLVDRATTIAQAFAQRRAALPPTDAELALHREWQRFAEANRFGFDERRLKLDGALSGTRVEIAIETVGRSVYTAVTAHFPEPLAIAFAALRTTVPGFLQGMVGQDIKIGHAAFDDAYQLCGYPEPAVREILRRPGLADALAWIAQQTAEAQMNHYSLYYRLPGAISSAETLGTVAETVRRVSESLFGAARTVGPYR